LAAEPPRSEQERGQGSLRASKRVLTKRTRTIPIALGPRAFLLGLAVTFHEEKSFVEGDEELLKGFARGAGDAPSGVTKPSFLPTLINTGRRLLRMLRFISPQQSYTYFSLTTNCFVFFTSVK
jgi:hypothetical protein